MSKKILKVLVPFMLILWMTACSGTNGSTASPSASATRTPLTNVTPAPVVQSPLVGEYDSVITSKDIDPNSPLVDNISTGTWLLNFRSDGHVTGEDGNYLTLGATYVVLGAYVVNGNLLTIHDSKCWEFWGDNAKTATYTWTLVGNALTLKAVGGDGCPGRKLLFAAHSWIRQS